MRTTILFFFSFFIIHVGKSSTVPIGPPCILNDSEKLVIIKFDWLPDGKGLILSCRTNSMNPDFTVIKMDLSTSQKTVLIKGATTPAVSPNGQIIAYTKNLDGGFGDIYLYDMKTGTSSLLVANSNSREFAPAWSPDGSKIVFDSEKGDVIQLKIVDVKTSQVSQVSANQSDKYYNPWFSPDGKMIVFFMEKGDHHDQIYVTDTKGGFFRNVTNDNTLHNFYPTWIDNNDILYTDQTKEGLWTMNIDGQKKSAVDSVNKKAFYAKYNSATQAIAYLTALPQGNLYIFSCKDKSSKQIYF